MLLVLNMLLNPETRQRYSSLIRDHIFCDIPIRIIELNDQIDNLENFSHLILIGSELSVMKGR